MRIGVLGGSFDPPHIGHLLVAGDAYDALSLDRVIFVPAAVQPLKSGQAGATPAQRRSMVELLVGDDARFAVDAIEIERAGLSYTVDTLTDFTKRWPAAELFFLIGADILRSFPQWRSPERIAELATIVVLQRAGDPMDSAALPPRARRLESRRVDVSSTEIRERVRGGKPIRGFVPECVADYIAAERLYQ